MTTTPLDPGRLGETAAAQLLALIDRDGEEARIVGGAVRNALLGLPPGDIDIATTAVPHEVMRRAEAAGFKAVPTGLAHGTVTVVVEGHPFEVTTLREDVETFGRHATVAFGRDWRRDAERRDFTIFGGDTTVTSALSGFCDASTRDDIQTFFKQHPLPSASRTLTQTVERINNCIALKTTQTAKVSEFLASR